MGAGASTANSSAASAQNSWVVSEIKDPNKPEYHLSIPSPFLLTITKESLDLKPLDTSNHTILHYPYHQIKCWSSTASYFSFQLGVEKVQALIKFQTTEGSVIQCNLMETILKFMSQSKQGALQPTDYKVFRSKMFDPMKKLNDNWNEVADKYFQSIPFRLTAAHSLDLLGDIDMSDEFVSLDFCCMLHKYILNQESFKLVMNSITDKQLKLNLASRLGLGVNFSDGVTVQCSSTEAVTVES
jgi:hypothetical protein